MGKVKKPYVYKDGPELFKKVAEAEPLKKIPHGLGPCIKVKSSFYEPPVLHIGWSVDEAMLLEWALDEGFETLAEDIDGRLVRDDHATLDAAIKYFAQRCGATSFNPYFQFTCHHVETCMVAVGSNYSISSELDVDFMKEDMERFCRLLHAEGFLVREDMIPRWYHDYRMWRWTSSSIGALYPLIES